MTENESNKERPQEVVLDSASEARLISRIKEAVHGGGAGAGSTSESSTPSELTDEEISALTDVIDEHIEKRIAEKVSAQQGKSTELTPEQGREEAIKEVSSHGRQGLSELLRVKYEAERDAKKKQ